MTLAQHTGSSTWPNLGLRTQVGNVEKCLQQYTNETSLSGPQMSSIYTQICFLCRDYAWLWGIPAAKQTAVLTNGRAHRDLCQIGRVFIAAFSNCVCARLFILIQYYHILKPYQEFNCLGKYNTKYEAKHVLSQHASCRGLRTRTSAGESTLSAVISVAACTRDPIVAFMGTMD